MTTIKATCPTCGEVGLAPDEIELRIDRSDAGESFYAFSCPSCFETVCKSADERIIRLLLSGGVEARDLGDEPERVRLDQRFDFPTLTPDDLLDFHALLETPGWFDLVVALSRRENVR
jgi:predicted RNA-binding Zn-ribbon protein involved in translation (DUF1610 family)